MLRIDELLLRPPAADDGPEVVALLSVSDDVARWTRVPFPYTPADFDAFLDRIAADEMSRAYLIERAGEVVGSIGARIDTMTATAVLGYWLAPAGRGSGVATRTGRVLCNALFEAGVERIEAIVAVGNPASSAVLERLGFTLEGVMRSVLVVGLGLEDRRRDVQMWSLLPRSV